MEMSHVISNVRIVVVLLVLTKPVPGLKTKCQVALFKDKVCIETVPAPGYGLVSAV